jgi:hypothetical protein
MPSNTGVTLLIGHPHVGQKYRDMGVPEVVAVSENMERFSSPVMWTLVVGRVKLWPNTVDEGKQS